MDNNKNIFKIYDPRGDILLEKRSLSNRKNTLEGLRLAILDNSKWNANKILRGSASALSQDIKFSKVNLCKSIVALFALGLVLTGSTPTISSFNLISETSFTATEI